jgi:hypothetical protein
MPFSCPARSSPASARPHRVEQVEITLDEYEHVRLERVRVRGTARRSCFSFKAFRATRSIGRARASATLAAGEQAGAHGFARGNIRLLLP